MTVASVFRVACRLVKLALMLAGAALLILWGIVAAMLARSALTPPPLTGDWESVGAPTGTGPTQANFVTIGLHEGGTGYAQIEFSPYLAPKDQGTFFSYYSGGIRWVRRPGNAGVVILASAPSNGVLGTFERVGRSEARLRLRSPDETIMLKHHGIEIRELFGD